MQNEKDKLSIPFMIGSDMSQEAYFDTYFLKNEALKAVLWEKQELLSDFDRLVKELEIRLHDLDKTNYWFTLTWFEWEAIIRFNRSLRAGNTVWVVEFLQDCITDAKDRLNRLKDAVPEPPVTSPVFDDIPDWLRSETDPVPVKEHKQKSVNEDDLPDWRNSEDFVVSNDSPYIRYLTESLHKPISSSSALDDIPKDSRFYIDGKMRDCATMSKTDRHAYLYHYHELIYNDNIARENLRFLERNGFGLLVYEQMLERFFGIVNRYGDWLDSWYLGVSSPTIVSYRPFTEYMKQSMTRAFSYLLREEYDKIFDAESNLKDGIDEVYLSERLRVSGVLTDDGADYEKIEHIIAGYE